MSRMSGERRGCCAFCGKSFETEPYRTRDGRFWCNEFCASDGEESEFQRERRKAS
jgi:hypothetical protein